MHALGGRQMHAVAASQPVLRAEVARTPHDALADLHDLPGDPRRVEFAPQARKQGRLGARFRQARKGRTSLRIGQQMRDDGGSRTGRVAN